MSRAHRTTTNRDHTEEQGTTMTTSTEKTTIRSTVVRVFSNGAWRARR